MHKPSKKFRIIVLLAIIAALIAAVYVFIHRGQESTDDAQVEAHIVTLSAKVPGYIKVLHIKDNQRVKAGDVLLEIDPTDYALRRDRAAATLEAAQAAYVASGHNVATTEVSAPSNLQGAKAQLDAAQASYDKAANDLHRLQRLSDEARSRQQLDEAVATEKSARSALEDAKAKLRSAQTAPKVIAAAVADEQALAAQVKQAQADLALAEKDLSDTKIIAPMDGRITRRGAELGDFIQQGQQIAYIVGNDRWVIANFKETQLKNMKTGQTVSVEVDALPGHDFKGKIESIQAGTGVRFSAFPPENATGNFVKIVQRVPVKIILDHAPDADLPIGPGMSVTPTVYTQ